MSKTFRKKYYNSCALRHPKTTNEISQINHILNDIKDEDYSISGINRMHSRLNIPTVYDDIVISSHYEMDYNK